MTVPLTGEGGERRVVYGYHTGCKHEGCWLVSIHSTREGARAAMVAAMEDADAGWSGKAEARPKWVEDDDGQDRYRRDWDWDGDGVYESEGSDLAFIEEHELLP